jgi:hypothetical protein
VKAALAKEPGLTVAQWHAALGLLTFKEVSAALAVGLWLLMAWAISQGRDVARFTFSAFFALITLVMLIALAQHGAAYAPADMIAGAAIWLIALITMVLIFTRPANTYYRQGARPPAAHTAG